MENDNNRYIFLFIILIINTIFSYIFLTNIATVIFSFIVFVPVAIYSLKYKLDVALVVSMIAISVSNCILYGIKECILYTVILMIPALVICYLVKQKMHFTKLVSLSSLLFFVCFLGSIILLKYVCDIDVITRYFNSIDSMKDQFLELYSYYFINNTNSIKEYSIAKGILKNSFQFMKYYYPALLYLLCLGISFISISFIRLIADKLKISSFSYKNILGLRVSRSIIGFLLILFLVKAFLVDDKSNIMIAINNIIVIIVVILFFLGILFEMSMIKRVRNVGRRVLLILVSIFCLLFFQAYFVVAGFIDSVFQLRVKLNNV